MAMGMVTGMATATEMEMEMEMEMEIKMLLAPKNVNACFKFYESAAANSAEPTALLRAWD